MTLLAPERSVPLWARDEGVRFQANGALFRIAMQAANTERGSAEQFVVAYFADGEPNADFSNIRVTGCQSQSDVDSFLGEQGLLEHINAYVWQQPNPDFIWMC